jgi:hypothetical protein
LIVNDERIDMKTTQIMAVAVLIVGASLALYVAQGQQLGFNAPRSGEVSAD